MARPIGLCSAKALLKSVSESAGKEPTDVSPERFVKLTICGADTHTWVYLGSQEDHVLIPGVFCSCKDFVVRVVSRKEKCYCKHLLGQKLAERAGKYRTVDLKDADEYLNILNEILTRSLTSMLRKKLFAGR